MPKERVHLIIRGEVQGVFFRASARQRANELGLKGWVRNNSDGSVEIVAEGERAALEEFTDWCHQGPRRSTVNHVVIKWESYSDQFDEFTIEYI